jgi:hydroxyacylglutathione hydrolase
VFVWSPGRPPERIADGVWLVRGGFPAKIMNVYLIEDAGGVTIYDTGISAMTGAVAAAAAGLGGITRVVLGHADADHRGAAPGLDAAVFCHEGDRAAAESSSPFRDYWDFAKLRVPVNVLMPKLLRHWDGGAVRIAGVLAEGEEVAGFRVLHLPGHAPGLIGLFRESDRLALCSDLIYTLDVQTSIPGRPRVPHPAFNLDTGQARASIRKLAAHDPAIVWPGHAGPVRGDVRAQLERAAAA